MWEYEEVVIRAAPVLGAILGSFYNVLIYRLPRGVSLVSPRSFCPFCCRTIPWYDNVPVVSYLLLGGKCRFCRRGISASYPLVEVLSALAAFLAVVRFDLTLKALWVYGFLSLLIVIAFIDWFHQIIPDVLSLGGMLLGWVGSLWILDLSPVDSFLGAAVGAGTLVIIAVSYRAVRKMDGLGGGDVKLMAMIGAFMGWQMVFPVLFIASFFGSLYGIYLIRSGGTGKTAVAFGSFLAPSASLILLFGPTLWKLYLSLYPR